MNGTRYDTYINSTHHHPRTDTKMNVAANIVVKNLTSYEACEKALQDIENHWSSVVGGQKAFFSGYRTELTVAAKAKMKAIEKHQDQFVSDEE